MRLKGRKLSKSGFFIIPAVNIEVHVSCFFSSGNSAMYDGSKDSCSQIKPRVRPFAC